MDGYYNDVIRWLKRAGYRRARTAGSHQVWVHANGNRVVVSTNMKSRHTANSILKCANIAHRF